MSSPRIVAIAGSLRAGSWNRKLLAVAAAAAEQAGAVIDQMDLKDPQLPLYDGDVEVAAYPPAVTAIKQRIAAAHGLLIASPEYNYGIPGGLKNWIDWLSRPPKEQPFGGKTIAVVSASTGPSGGMRMQPLLRQALASLGAWIVPQQIIVPRCADAFDDAGQLKDAKLHELLVKTVGQLVDHCRPR